MATTFGDSTIDIDKLTSGDITTIIRTSATEVTKEQYEELFKNGQKSEYYEAISDVMKYNLLNIAPTTKKNIEGALAEKNLETFLEIINKIKEKAALDKVIDNLSILLTGKMDKIKKECIVKYPILFTRLMKKLTGKDLSELMKAIVMEETAIKYIVEHKLHLMLSEEKGYNYTQFEALSKQDTKLFISSKIVSMGDTEVDKLFKNINIDDTSRKNYANFYKTLTNQARNNIISSLINTGKTGSINILFCYIELEPNKKGIDYNYAMEILKTIVARKPETIKKSKFKNKKYVQNIICLLKYLDKDSKKTILFNDDEKIVELGNTIVTIDNKYSEELAASLSDDEFNKVFNTMSPENRKIFVGKLSISQKARAMRFASSVEERKDLIKEEKDEDLAKLEQEQKEELSANKTGKSLSEIQKRKERIKTDKEEIIETQNKNEELRKEIKKLEKEIEKFKGYLEGKRMIRPGVGFKRHILRSVDSHMDFWANHAASRLDFVSEFAMNKINKLLEERKNVEKHLADLQALLESKKVELANNEKAIELKEERIDLDTAKIKAEKIAMRDARKARKKNAKNAKNMIDLLRKEKLERESRVGAITNTEINKEIADRAWAIIAGTATRSKRLTAAVIKSHIASDSVIATLNNEQLETLVKEIQKEIKRLQDLSMTEEDFQEQLEARSGMRMGISNAIMIVTVTAAVIMGLILLVTLIIS